MNSEEEEQATRAAEERRAWREAQGERTRSTLVQAQAHERQRPRRRRERRFWIWIALGSGLPAALLGLVAGPYLAGAVFLCWLGYCTARIVLTMEVQSHSDVTAKGILVFLGLLVLSVAIVVGLFFAGCAVILQLIGYR